MIRTVLLLQLLISLLCVPVVWAQSIDQQISRLINRGQFTEAQALLDNSNPSYIDKLFFYGRSLKALQKFSDAALVFEEILRRDPTHLNAKRELAHTLLLAKQYVLAENRFHELLRVDANAMMSEGYRRYIDVIEKNKPFDIKLILTILPSSNINKGTDNLVFDTSIGDFVIDPLMRAEPGVGVQYGVSGFFRNNIDLHRKYQLDWEISRTVYSNESFNHSTSLVSLTYGEKSSKHNWSISPFSRNIWRERVLDSNVIGLRFNSQRALSLADSLAVSVLREYRTYSDRNYQDGPFTTATLSITHLLENSLSISAGVQGEASSPQAEHIKYVGEAVFAEIRKDGAMGHLRPLVRKSETVILLAITRLQISRVQTHTEVLTSLFLTKNYQLQVRLLNFRVSLR